MPRPEWDKVAAVVSEKAAEQDLNATLATLTDEQRIGALAVCAWLNRWYDWDAEQKQHPVAHRALAGMLHKIGKAVQSALNQNTGN